MTARIDLAWYAAGGLTCLLGDILARHVAANGAFRATAFTALVILWGALAPCIWVKIYQFQNFTQVAALYSPAMTAAYLISGILIYRDGLTVRTAIAVALGIVAAYIGGKAA